MTKTDQLVKLVNDGTHRIDNNGCVYRKVTVTRGHTLVGDWVRVAGKWRSDVVLRASVQLKKEIRA